MFYIPNEQERLYTFQFRTIIKFPKNNIGQMNLRSVKILSISSQTRHKCYSNLSIGNVSKLSIHGKFGIDVD